MDLFPHTTQAPPRRHGAGRWAVVFAFVAVMAFSTVPTPLYTLYQARDGFSTFVVTVIFAAYAVGVIVALFFAGHVSDWVGRRRALVPAVLLSVAAAVAFLVWRALPGLLVGRVLSGLSVGVVTATATAYLAELHVGARPGASPARAQVLATSANLGGLGLGPLVSGLLAQSVAAPLTACALGACADYVVAIAAWLCSLRDGMTATETQAGVVLAGFALVATWITGRFEQQLVSAGGVLVRLPRAEARGRQPLLHLSLDAYRVGVVLQLLAFAGFVLT